MSLKSIANAVAFSAILSASLLPMASAAQARDGRHSGHFERHGNIQRGWNGHNRHAWGHGHGRRHHRGRNVALGAFAAVLGLAIAAEVARANEDAYYDDRD